MATDNCNNMGCSTILVETPQMKDHLRCSRRQSVCKTKPSSYKSDYTMEPSLRCLGVGLVRTLSRSRLQPPKLLLLLLAVGCLHPPVSGQESCSLQRAEITIRYRHCAPVTILALSCLGYCHSYTQINSNFPERLETSCRCCKDAGRPIRRRVRFRCPSPLQPGKNVFIVLRINLPTRCACRPCSS